MNSAQFLRIPRKADIYFFSFQARRTVKFLCGVARGIPVVIPEWLQNCKAAHKFLGIFFLTISHALNLIMYFWDFSIYFICLYLVEHQETSYIELKF